jgi:hypothetical protein
MFYIRWWTFCCRDRWWWILDQFLNKGSAWWPRSVSCATRDGRRDGGGVEGVEKLPMWGLQLNNILYPATVQVVSRRPHPEGRAPSSASPCGICGRKIFLGQVFVRVLLLAPVSIILSVLRTYIWFISDRRYTWWFKRQGQYFWRW